MTQERIKDFINSYIYTNQVSLGCESIASACQAAIDWAVKETTDQACEHLKGLTFQAFAGAPKERMVSDDEIRTLRMVLEIN